MKVSTLILLFTLLSSIYCEKIDFEGYTEGGFADKIKNAENLINMITETWGKLVNTFKTTRSSTLKEKIQKQGFQTFKGRAMVQAGVGVRENFYEKFIEKLAIKIEMPEATRKLFVSALEEAEYGDANSWIGFDILYEKDQKQDKVDYATVVVNYREDAKKFDVLFSYLNADFKLAHDVLVFTQSNSYVGGIYTSEKDIIKEVPKTLTNEELKSILTGFQLVLMKILSEYFGVKGLTFPDGTQ